MKKGCCGDDNPVIEICEQDKKMLECFSSCDIF